MPLEDGLALPEPQLDIWTSDVALLPNHIPELRATIRIGQLMSRVMRHGAQGAGAASVEPLEPEAIHEPFDTITCLPSPRSAAARALQFRRSAKDTP